MREYGTTRGAMVGFHSLPVFVRVVVSASRRVGVWR
jgi:hypothetical protein